MSWNKVQPRHAGCQVSNLCVAGKGIAGSPGTNHRAATGVLPCPPPMLPVSRQSPHPPGTQAAALPPAPSPGRARSAWATCEEPKDRGRPSPAPTGVGTRCSQRAWPLRGEREARACPCFGLQGELHERDVLHLQLLAVIQARLQLSPWPRSVLLFALTQPGCCGAWLELSPVSLVCMQRVTAVSRWDVS